MDSGAKRDFKDRLYEQFARIGKALSSGRRLELIELLAQRERSVEELAKDTALSVANCSQHLQILRAAKLVEVRRDGLFARYRLADETVLRLWLALREIGESRLAEISRLVESFRGDRRALEAISFDELRRRLKARSIVLLDVRPAEEYDAGHIPGARSMPVSELKRRLRELPKARQIAAYCRGPYCVLADEAVALLRSRGFRAVRLEGGLPDWKAQGLPVELCASTEVSQ
jgi:rhodanese-related sulfurtransferase/DNA-binding transcriptional ArsR family regulator